MVKRSDEFVNDCIPKHCSACLSFNVFNVSVARVITIRLFSLFRLLLAKNLQISFLARFLLAVYLSNSAVCYRIRLIDSLCVLQHSVRNFTSRHVELINYRNSF